MIEKVRKVLEAEALAITSIPLSSEVERAIAALIACKGKVFTTGIGKAGYVAKKAASTFSTTGTPSAFIHPGDAPHGDVGVVSRGDILIGYSNSGKTREIIETVHLCRKLGAAKVISIVSTKDSPLGKESDIVIEIGSIKEPCPLGFTPSASTSAMLAISDALALVTMEERGFSKEEFAVRHHGGYLGRKSRDEE